MTEKAEPEYEPLRDMAEFFFELPLYAPRVLTQKQALHLYGFQHGGIVDGWCPFCQKETTFSFDSTLTPAEAHTIDYRVQFDERLIVCSRSSYHVLKFYFSIGRLIVQKVGQYPSIADITNSELGAFRKFMEKADASEFYKAVGLAAHGVGIGSFVYLRRVFERLIWTRFDEFEASEGWDRTAFSKMRMTDKIAHLSGHLPSFLVENKEVYSILSVGIHMLDEKQCLGYFGLMRESIVLILEEDKKKKEELDRRALLRQAIKDVNLPNIREAENGETD